MSQDYTRVAVATADSPDDGLGVKRRRVVNRPRPIVSCLSCRSRKLKCSRESPCQRNQHLVLCRFDVQKAENITECTRAGRANTCSYASGPAPFREGTRQTSGSDGQPSPRAEPPRNALTPSTNGVTSWPSPNRQDSQEPRGRIEDVERFRSFHQPPPANITRPAEMLKKKGTRTRYTQADFKQAMLEKVIKHEILVVARCCGLLFTPRHDS